MEWELTACIRNRICALMHFSVCYHRQSIIPNRVGHSPYHIDTFFSYLSFSDLSNNKIESIHDAAFRDLDKLEDLNLGVNDFEAFPSQGLASVVHLKTHNNPKLTKFPGAPRFPRARSLVLSYAYHCCQFLPSTYAPYGPDYGDFGTGFGSIRESVFFPGEGNFDHSLWHANSSELWGGKGEREP